MHVQVVTYRLPGMTEAEFIEGNQEFAEMMAVVPGLLPRYGSKALTRTSMAHVPLARPRGV